MGRSPKSGPSGERLALEHTPAVEQAEQRSRQSIDVDTRIARASNQIGGRALLERLRQPTSPAAVLLQAEMLTARDRDVLRRLAEGATNREIAGELALIEGTAKNYISALLAKTRCTTEPSWRCSRRATASTHRSRTEEIALTQSPRRAGRRTDTSACRRYPVATSGTTSRLELRRRTSYCRG